MKPEELLEHLKQLEHELHHPGKACDVSRLNMLLHPDFHEVGRSGIPYDRDTVIRYLGSLEEFPEVIPLDHALTVLGQASALLTYRSVNVRSDGAYERETYRSSIWRLHNGHWKLYYHQGTPEHEAG